MAAVLEPELSTSIMHTPVISAGAVVAVKLLTLLQTVLILYVITVEPGITQFPFAPAETSAKISVYPVAVVNVVAASVVVPSETNPEPVWTEN